MGTSITVKYTLTKEIYRNAAIHLGRKVTGISLWTSFLLIWSALTLMSNWLLSTQLMTLSAAGRLMVAGLLSGAVLAIIAFRLRKTGSEVETQEMTFIFSELGVEKRTLHSESKLEWKAYIKFSETDKYYFLHYSSRLADVVPKNSFATPQDAATFRELLTHQVRSAALDPHPVFGRTRVVYLVLLFIVVMMLTWTRPLWLPKAGKERPPVVPAPQMPIAALEREGMSKCNEGLALVQKYSAPPESEALPDERMKSAMRADLEKAKRLIEEGLALLARATSSSTACYDMSKYQDALVTARKKLAALAE